MRRAQLSSLILANQGFGGSLMKKIVYAASIGAALIGSVLSAQAAGGDSGLEFGFLPSTMTVTLLNEGGKYVAVDLKRIPQGGTCRMDKDAIIARLGPGATGMTRVRFTAPQLSSGGCPFMTQFDLPDADYAVARAAFVQKKDEASKKLDEVKKQLGDKWNEVNEKKSN
jgi:hypothetical protein